LIEVFSKQNYGHLVTGGLLLFVRIDGANFTWPEWGLVAECGESMSEAYDVLTKIVDGNNFPVVSGVGLQIRNLIFGVVDIGDDICA
jgi:hypothetical protein